MYLLGAVVLLTVLLWFLQGQRSKIRRHGQRLPRPPGTLPLAGNGFWFLQPRHKLLTWFSECERKVGFGTFEISVPSLPPAIVINDPKNVEHVLKNNDIFIKGDFFKLRSWDLFGYGIINADGELWRTQRKAGLPFFNSAQLKVFVDDVLPTFLADTKKTLDVAAQASKPVDLQEIFLELTTRLMGKMAYDLDMTGSMPFSRAFDFASGAIGDRFQNPFWKIKEIFFGSALRKAVQEVRHFGACIVSTAVQRRLEDHEPKKTPMQEKKSMLQTNLIDSLLDNIADHQVVADAAMNYLSAGRDTTAQSMTWTFYCLIRNPSAIRSVLSELRILSLAANGGLDLSFSTVQAASLPVTAAVYFESLRLYPPVPIELKECTTETLFPDGTALPKGAIVMWAPWAMGRSKHIWGDDADTFRPQRWLDASSRQLITKSAFEFPVFNGGPRACLGRKMAELLAVYVTASLVWEYEFDELTEKTQSQGGETPERRSQNSLTLPMQGGLPVYARRRVSSMRR